MHVNEYGRCRFESCHRHTIIINVFRINFHLHFNLPSRAEASVPGNHYIQTNERKNIVSSVARFVDWSNGNGNPEKRTLSRKEIRRLKILRNKLAVLCPEISTVRMEFEILSIVCLFLIVSSKKRMFGEMYKDLADILLFLMYPSRKMQDDSFLSDKSTTFVH